MLSRRDLLKNLLFFGALFSVGCNGVTLREESRPNTNQKIISDPRIIYKFNDLVEKLGKNELTDYADEESFAPVIKAIEEIKQYAEKLGVTFNLSEIDFRLKIPDDLMDKYSKSLDNFYNKKRRRRVDISDNIENLEEYIKERRLGFNDIVYLANQSRVVLIGEDHLCKAHGDLELKLFDAIDKKDLALASECFQINKKDTIEKILDGDTSELINFSTHFFTYETLKEFFEKVISLKIPIVLTDVLNMLTNLDSKLLLSDPRREYIRDILFAEQIEYAVNLGLNIFGYFGDKHLSPDQLPTYLKRKRIIPLIISGSFYTTEVFNAAMEVSQGEDVFFKRSDDRIIYVSKEDKKGEFESKEFLLK